jgi:hypothetical protein
MVELYSKDDIVIFSNGAFMFGEKANNYNNASGISPLRSIFVTSYLTPENEEYWEYFFDIEE